MKDVYVFPAIFTFEPEGVSVEFADLPGCLTFGSDWTEAMAMSKDALALRLYTMERDAEGIPEPSGLNELRLEGNQRTSVVEVWMPEFRSGQDTKPVKKTLTIPQWLNEAAEQNHINFSSLLQESLKVRLGVSEPIHRARRRARS